MDNVQKSTGMRRSDSQSSALSAEEFVSTPQTSPTRPSKLNHLKSSAIFNEAAATSVSSRLPARPRSTILLMESNSAIKTKETSFVMTPQTSNATETPEKGKKKERKSHKKGIFFEILSMVVRILIRIFR